MSRSTPHISHLPRPRQRRDELYAVAGGSSLIAGLVRLVLGSNSLCPDTVDIQGSGGTAASPGTTRRAQVGRESATEAGRFGRSVALQYDGRSETGDSRPTRRRTTRVTRPTTVTALLRTSPRRVARWSGSTTFRARRVSALRAKKSRRTTAGVASESERSVRQRATAQNRVDTERGLAAFRRTLLGGEIEAAPVTDVGVLAGRR